MQFATHGLSNSSFLVGELAVYTCDNGFLMVVNSSNSPVATEQVFVCSSLTPPFHFSCPGSSCVLVIRILGTNPPLDLCGRVPTWSGVARVGELVDQHHLHPARTTHRPHRPPSPAPLLWKAAMFFLSQVSFSKIQTQTSSTKLLAGRQRSQQRRRSGVQEERLGHLHHLRHLRHHLLRPTHRAPASTASRQD